MSPSVLGVSVTETVSNKITKLLHFLRQKDRVRSSDILLPQNDVALT